MHERGVIVMKKKITIFFLIVSLIVITTSFALVGNAEQSVHKTIIILDLSEKELTTGFILPASVEIIEEEAFEGTAIIKIELPETVKSVGDRAFANIDTLRSIRIPLATKVIAATAFAGSKNVTINAVPNSYARKFARTQGLPFSPVASFCATNQGTMSFSSAEGAHFDFITVISEEYKLERNYRQLEEYNVVGTLDIIFNEIQGRGPPMRTVTC